MEFSFEFQPSTTRPQPPDLDPLLACLDLIEALNDEAEDRWDDAPFVEDTADTPAGGVIALMNTAGDGTEIRTWLTEYAQRLTDQGWTGQIRGAHNPQPPAWSNQPEQLGHAIGIHLRFNPQPETGPFPYGTDAAAEDRAALIQSADMIDARFPAPLAYIGRGIFRSPAPQPRRGSAWIDAAARSRFTSLTWINESTLSVSRAQLSPGAKATITLASATEPWHAQLDVLIQILTQHGPRLEYGVARTCHPLSGPTEAPPAVRPGENVSTRDLDIARHYVLDAAGIQVLTGTHLAKAHDLSAWTITDLGNNRHLVRHPDPAAWYANELPDPDVLTTARHDFGELILTQETYGALRTP
ncbi:hypothetical protein [Myceligenerans pegani]|uniref:Uncharacterized protein n=1 Tax=Myceligenerans pegani TaxID=2776917 RepID=A0ABR9N1G7_9MICO|nr:hypothetical protein [Myceligenerans sp. TRM 65318]MBE1877499.1 hypothetical protein [Myceligenerans sp. TRM 65318]MBE3019770.1 hypothetical protein [Myceligenerans sp. TRM 65318]